MGKTIKQLAEEIGVSKQAVQKRLAREPLCTSVKPYIYTVDGIKYIEVVGENIVKSAFSKRGIDKSVDVSIDKNATLSIDKMDESSTELTAIIGVLQSTIDTLQGQLATKDEQILNLQSQIAQLTTSLENTTAALTASQALHAADKKLMLLEEENNNRKLSFWQRRAFKKSQKKQ